MADKVMGGTPQGEKSLCTTCRMAQNIRGLNFQEVVLCHAYTPAFAVPFPVETCSIYDDKRVPSLYQMERIAWAVTSRSRGPVGFGGAGAQEVHIEPPIQSPQQPGMPPITGKTDPVDTPKTGPRTEG